MGPPLLPHGSLFTLLPVMEALASDVDVPPGPIVGLLADMVEEWEREREGEWACLEEVGAEGGRVEEDVRWDEAWDAEEGCEVEIRKCTALLWELHQAVLSICR